MKKFALLFFALIILKTVNAQERTEAANAVSIGFDLGVPSHNAYSIGLTGSVKGELKLLPMLSLTGTAAYAVFYHKASIISDVYTQGPSTFIPLKGGLRYFAGSGVYIEGELGTAIQTNYEQLHLFAFSIGPGFNIPIDEHRNVDLGFRYENWSQHQLQQTAIRIAYRWR